MYPITYPFVFKDAYIKDKIPTFIRFSDFLDTEGSADIMKGALNQQS